MNLPMFNSFNNTNNKLNFSHKLIGTIKSIKSFTSLNRSSCYLRNNLNSKSHKAFSHANSKKALNNGIYFSREQSYYSSKKNPYGRSETSLLKHVPLHRNYNIVINQKLSLQKLATNDSGADVHYIYLTSLKVIHCKNKTLDYSRSNNSCNNITQYMFGRSQTSLLKCIPYLKIQQRSMMQANTKLTGPEKIVCKKMLQVFVTYASETRDFTAQTRLKLCEDLLKIDVRLGQHLIEVIFHNKPYQLSVLRENLKSDIHLTNQSHTDIVDNSYVVASIHAKMLKEQPFFKKGNLTVLEPPKSLKNINIEKALKDTKQPCPDYLYEILNPIFEHHFDLKTTKADSFDINKGHVLSVADPELYKQYVEKLLTEQAKFYRRTYPEIKDFFDKILNSPDDWATRNEKVHEFYLNVLHRFPEIHPSLIFKHELPYNLKEIKAPKYIETMLSHYNLSGSRELSERVFVDILRNKPDAAYRFFNYNDHNENIKNALKDILKTWINEHV